MVFKEQQGRVRDVLVVGGGPVGSYAAWRLSSLGMDVTLLEKKQVVGRPMHCAGLVNSSMFDLPGLSEVEDRVTLKRIKGADIYSPSGEMIPLMGKEVKAVSMNRSSFDLELLRKAAASGAEVLISSNVTGNSMNSQDPKVLKVTTHDGAFDISGRVIIACDGSGSNMRRLWGFSRPMEVIPGVSLELEMKKGIIPDDRVAVLTGNEIAKGFFAWIVPSFGTNGIRIGLSATSGEDLRKGLKILLRDERMAAFLSLERIDSRDYGTISYVFGSVPMGQPEAIHKGGILLLGDSAGMAKPTSGGGIFPALRAVEQLERSFKDNGKDPERSLMEFETAWNKGYGRELSRTLLLRKITRELTDKEMNKAIHAFNDEKKLALINETGDIDHPLSLAVKLLRLDPKLLMLAPRFLPYLKRLL